MRNEALTLVKLGLIWLAGLVVGWKCHDVLGPQQANKLLECGFTIIDPEGKEVAYFED
jgi:hypothetical protein